MKYSKHILGLAIALASGQCIAMTDAELKGVTEQRLLGDRTGACFAVAVIDESISRAYVCADPKNINRISPAVLHLSQTFKKALQAEQRNIYDAYLAHAEYVNNWDLVDSSAPYIVGPYLFDRSRSLLMRLVKSKSLWERRIAVLATHHFIKLGETEDIVKLAKLLLNDKEDLMHKAVGWMLREMGGRGNMPTLFAFLNANAPTMPRTMLRYAIEKLPETTRQHYLKTSPEYEVLNLSFWNWDGRNIA